MVVLVTGPPLPRLLLELGKRFGPVLIGLDRRPFGIQPVARLEDGDDRADRAGPPQRRAGNLPGQRFGGLGF
jgi:hypothetical protein